MSSLVAALSFSQCFLLVAFMFSSFFCRATMGPFISGICDQHFGFQWAMSVAGFICLSHAVLLVVFTLYEYVVISREHVDNRLLDDEEKLLSTNWNVGESAEPFAWSHREPCKPNKCKSIAGKKGYWSQLALTSKKPKSWLGVTRLQKNRVSLAQKESGKACYWRSSS